DLLSAPGELSDAAHPDHPGDHAGHPDQQSLLGDPGGAPHIADAGGRGRIRVSSVRKERPHRAGGPHAGPGLLRARSGRDHAVAALLRICVPAGTPGPRGPLHGLRISPHRHRVFRGGSAGRQPAALFRRGAAPATANVVGGERGGGGDNAPHGVLRPLAEARGAGARSGLDERLSFASRASTATAPPCSQPGDALDPASNLKCEHPERQKPRRPARSDRRSSGPRGLIFETPNQESYFAPSTASLNALTAKILATVFALILMASPVCGLRPMRAARWRLTQRPMPGITNFPALPLHSLAARAARASKKPATCFFFSSHFSAIAATT